MPRNFRERTNLFVISIAYNGPHKHEPDPEDVLDEPSEPRDRHISEQFNNLIEAAKYFREKLFEIKEEADRIHQGKNPDSDRIMHLSLTYYSEVGSGMGVPRGVSLAWWNRSGMGLGQVEFGPAMDKIPNVKATLQLPNTVSAPQAADLYQQWQQRIADQKTIPTKKV